jgi:hypothetical protein
VTLELIAQSDERLGFIGQTRMGKTFLVERLAEAQPRIIVVDSKHRVNWKGYYLTDNPAAALLEDRVIYRPPTGVPPADWWEAALDSLTERGGGVIYIDEMPVIVTSNQIPKGLAKIFRVGGELGVGVWWSAQESTTIHNTTMRQCNQLILFYNQGVSDREKIMGIVGDMAEGTGTLPPYDFIVFVRGETTDNEKVPVYRVVP